MGWILFFAIFFGANPPSSEFLTFLGIFSVITLVLAIIAAWKEGNNK